MTIFDDLPDDVIRVILSRVPLAADIARVQCVSRRLHRLGADADVIVKASATDTECRQKWVAARPTTVVGLVVRGSGSFEVPLFPRLRALSSRGWFAPPPLPSLRYASIHTYNRPRDSSRRVFQLSSLDWAASLRTLDLGLGRGWRSAEISVPTSWPLRSLFLKTTNSDIIVLDLGGSGGGSGGGVDTVSLESLTGMVFIHNGNGNGGNKSIRPRRVHIAAANCQGDRVLAALATPDLRELHIEFPNSRLAWPPSGQCDPRAVVLEAASVVVTGAGPRLTQLGLVVDRLSTVALPARVRVDAVCRGFPVSRDFFP